MPKLPLSADEVLNRYFLETRGKLLEIAATLDRIDRARDGAILDEDPRYRKLLAALALLAEPAVGPAPERLADRAERMQMLFSRPYDENWINEFEPVPRANNV